MAILSTVNFEDLFDFSPEPVDALAEIESESAVSVTTKNTSSSSHHSTTAPLIINNGSGNSNIQLSQSLPTTLTPAFKTASTNVSQLLQDLPEVLSETGQFAVGSYESTDFLLNRNSLPTSQLESGNQAPVVQQQKSKRGRKPGQKNLKTDMKSKLERSRQSARECRARKKLRYQYLDDLILERERANLTLKEELAKYQQWCHELDAGKIPEGIEQFLQTYDSKNNKE